MTTIAQLIIDKTTRYDKYIAAEDAILSGAQSYSIGNRTLTRADLANVQNMIKRLETDLIKLGRGNYITAHRVVPRDTV